MSASAQAVEERRIFGRFSARFPAKFKDSRQEHGTNVFLQDASAQGMRILTKERFFLEDQIDLEVELPGTAPMTLSGRVVWVRNLNPLWDTGVQFHQVNLFRMHRLVKLAEDITQHPA